MASEDDRERRRAALLAMQPQAGRQQEPVQRAPEVRDLSQLRPVVQRTVTEGKASQEERAQRVIGSTYQLFMGAIEKSGDQSLRRAVRDSSLATLLG